MNLVEVLKEARELISSPDRWTKMMAARGPNGGMASPNSYDGERFCSIGAIQHVIWRKRAPEKMGDLADFGIYHSVCNLLARGWGCETTGREGHTVSWKKNDFSTHEQVLEAFDVAILRAELDASSVLEPTPDRELVTA